MSDATYAAIAIWSEVAGSLLWIAALVYLWMRFAVPAVVSAQERRNAELAAAESRRDAALADAEAAKGELAAAESEAAEIAARAQADAADLRERLIAQARAESERLMRNAGGELERGRAVARDELRASLVEKALAIARDRSSRLDERTDRRLIDETVAVADRGGPA